ncbi:MAG: hypothetical protein GX963_14960 [Bacteroidales bacterium]|nr:hypothetical protein [Bacteroidales bacterium]
MKLTEEQLKEIAKAGGIKEVDLLVSKKSDNQFELGFYNDKKEWDSILSLEFIVGACADRVEFKTSFDDFDEDMALKRMVNLGLIDL